MHQEFELCGIRETSSKRHRLVTVGSCHSLDGLEEWISWSTSKEIVEEPRNWLWEVLCSPHRCGEEQLKWNRGVEWFFHSSRLKIKRVLDRGAVDSWNPPQCGLGVTGKSSTPRKKILVSSLAIFLALFDYCIYFEQFTLLELELYLVILGCKPKLEIVVVWHMALLCY